MSPAQHAFRAWRLRARAFQSKNPLRQKMLILMSKAEMSFGLSEQHRSMGSGVQAGSLFLLGEMYLQQAREVG